MLPGLRFLFAAIVLATSLLVFGLGAAALFRAAHEEFASIPARRAPPEPQFAQQTEAQPVLAMVRVEPSAAEKLTAEKVTTDKAAPATSAASESAPPAEASPAAEPEKLAAVKTDDPTAPAPAKPDTQAAETPAPAQPAEVAPQAPAADPAPQAAPVAAETAPVAAEAKVAAMPDPSAAASAPAPAAPTVAVAAPEPVAAPSPGESEAATKIATLGGPEVVVEQPVAPKTSEAKKPERSTASKPAPRHKERRRIVRTQPARQVVQQQLDPFGNPTLVPLTRR